MIPIVPISNPAVAPPPVQPQIFSQVSSDAVLGRLPATAVSAGVGLSETFNRTKKPVQDVDGFSPQLTPEELTQYSEIKYMPSGASRPPEPRPAFHFLPPPPPENPITAYVEPALRVPEVASPPVKQEAAPPAETLPAPDPLPKSLVISASGADAYRSASIRNTLNLALPSEAAVDVLL